jgi:hypothetical protein
MGATLTPEYMVVNPEGRPKFWRDPRPCYTGITSPRCSRRW